MRICETMKLYVDFMNPVCTKKAGIGHALHVNFSTKKMRGPGGIK